MSARSLAGALALILLVPASAAAADDPLLAALVGKWVGDGMTQPGPDATPERVFCRLTATLEDDGRTLRQRGRCAVANNTSAFEVVIRAGDANAYSGSMLTAANGEEVAFTGVGSARRITLESVTTDDDGNPADATNVLEATDDGYRLTATSVRQDGTPGPASDIAFTPDE